jgi:hypothetical protein
MLKSSFQLKDIFSVAAVSLIVLFISNKVSAQTSPGMREITKGSSNQTVFSYRIQSTYGTTTSAQVNGNIVADTEAVLKLKSGSKLTNKSGDASGNSSIVFTATPTGANVNLSGLTGENLFLIDDGTYFRSALKTIDNLNPALTSSGTASATATHSMTIIIEKNANSIQNYLEKAY